MILDIGDTLEAFILDKIRDILDQARLVHAVGDLGDDDLESAVLRLNDLGLSADNDLAAAGRIRGADARPTHDQTACREIGSRHTLHQIGDLGVGIVDQQTHCVDGLAEVVGRDVGRHTDRDTVTAVDQQIRETRGQNRGLLEYVVEGRHEIDGILVDIRKHLRRDLAHAGLGVSVRRGGVAVDGTEVAVTVDQHIAHREILR